MAKSRAMLLAVAIIVLMPFAIAQSKPRARDLGVPFDGQPGPLNAITDVKGVEVGHATLISGSGKLKVGEGPVRTGVTAILPRGKESKDAVFGGWFTLNGNGEMTGTTWVEDSGFVDGPIMITNTHSVGAVRDAVIAWKVKRGQPDMEGYWWSLPVVAETWDGFLNDINGFHVKPEHVFAALDAAGSGRVAEGNVGGGTGMVCYGFKCGSGTSSRKIDARFGGYTVGIFVQANHGTRSLLRVAGAPVGQEIPQSPSARNENPASALDAIGEAGSIIIVVATDAPLVPHQLKRIARRAALGLARTGSVSSNGAGDIFIAFSTANAGAADAREAAQVSMLSNARIGAVFGATVQATEEAILNALVARGAVTGGDK